MASSGTSRSKFFGGHRVLFWVGRRPLWFNVTAEKTEQTGVIYWGGEAQGKYEGEFVVLPGNGRRRGDYQGCL